MRHFIRVSGLVLAGLVSIGTTAFADHFVNPATGSDSNTGTTALDAWQSITHANNMLGEMEIVQLAPGVYSTASGEVFPINLSTYVSYQGKDPATTFIDGGGSTILRWTDEFGPAPTLIEGVTLMNGDVGLFVGGGFACDQEDPPCYGPSFTVENLVITGCQTGMDLGGTDTYLRFNDCSFINNVVGIVVTGGGVRLNLERCDISGNFQQGIVQNSGGQYLLGSNYVNMYLQSCTVTNNGSHGIEVNFEAEGGASIAHTDLYDTLVASNGGDGLNFGTVSPNPYTNDYGRAYPVFSRSTIANNAGFGIFAETAKRDGTPQHAVVMNSTIVHGNGDDIEWTDPAAFVEYSDIGDGDFVGTNSNFSADPGFRNSGLGDYRLKGNSSCIDKGITKSAGLFDVIYRDPLGVARDVDGNLNLVKASDIGAYELATLYLTNEATPGANLKFELTGRGFGLLRMVPGPPLVIPVNSLFGDYYLDHTFLVYLGSFDAGLDPPGLANFKVLNNRSVLGQQFTFQALLSSRIAPFLYAASNPVTVTVGLN